MTIGISICRTPETGNQVELKFEPVTPENRYALSESLRFPTSSYEPPCEWPEPQDVGRALQEGELAGAWG